MFVGHFAVGLAAKPFAPRVSLATLILAAAFADLLWIVFFVTGLEHVEIAPGLMATNSLNLVSVPFSHSLLMDAVWALLCAGIYFLARRDSRGAWIIAAAVLSHWVLDVVTHRPDMQLAPGIDTRLGLGLWNSPTATLIVEGLVRRHRAVRASDSRERPSGHLRILVDDRRPDGAVADQSSRRSATKPWLAGSNRHGVFRSRPDVGGVDEPCAGGCDEVIGRYRRDALNAVRESPEECVSGLQIASEASGPLVEFPRVTRRRTRDSTVRLWQVRPSRRVSAETWPRRF